MSGLTRDESRTLLFKAAERTIEIAQHDIVEQLPREIRMELAAFGRGHQESSVDEILAYICKAGTFPRIVDVTLIGASGDHSIIWVRPSGHRWVSEIQAWGHSRAWDSYGVAPYSWRMPHPQFRTPSVGVPSKLQWCHATAYDATRYHHPVVCT